MQQSSQKRSQFRNQIRRKQIEQLFSEGRQLKQAQQQQKQHERISKLTQTPQARKLFILQKKQKLDFFGQKQLASALKELLVSVRYFESNFDDWIQAGLIGKIVSLFKKQHRPLNLMDLAALILQDIFYFLPSASPQLTAIINYNFIPDIVDLCGSSDVNATNYFLLISTMLYEREKLKQQFVSNGFIQVISLKLKSYEDLQTEEVSLALTAMYRLLKTNENSNFLNGNIVSIFLPILNVYIAATKNPLNLSKILKSVSALANTEKQPVLTAIFQSTNIIPFTLQFFCEGETIDIRAASASIIASILKSDSLIYSKRLIEMGVIDLMLKCVGNPNNHESYLQCILTCLSNLITNSYEETCVIYNHQIFRYFIIPCSKDTTNLKMHQIAIYAIATIIGYQSKVMVNELVHNYGLLEILVGGLASFPPCMATILESLRALTVVIHMYSENHENIIINDLHRFFNIENLLTDLDGRLRNKLVHAKIEQFNNFLLEEEAKLQSH